MARLRLKPGSPPGPGYGREAPGAMVIRALVRARLLGLQLLTLEAQVVVRPHEDDGAGMPLVAVTSQGPAELTSRPAAPPELRGSQPPLERAAALVEQSTVTLDRSRQPR